MRKYLLILTGLSFVIASRAQTVLPTPQEVRQAEGEFRFDEKTSVSIADKKSYVLPYLESILHRHLSGRMALVKNKTKAEILFTVDHALPNEGYELIIQPEMIQVKAAGDAGFFYAVQSLDQLLAGTGSGQVPCVVIKDSPRYKLRSFLLDSGRQYQSIATIKKYLDMMAMLKMNTFHWHLTEGLGWRLEIKKYPALTRKGAFVSSGAEQQGYYTRQDVKEIIRYAADRNITVMPEIDMPGHAEAALIAYPEFSCFGDTTRLKDGEGFSKNIFCAGKPRTMAFLKDVLDEVCKLFPSNYIHVGGDEAPKENWNGCPDCQNLIKEKNLKNSEQLQTYFSAEIASYLNSKGRKAVFWDEIVNEEGYQLPENVVVHWWAYRGRKDKPLHSALERGMEVICGTNFYTYLNMPLTPWRGYEKNRTFDIRDIYERNPSMNRDGNPLVIGMSSAMWTDYNVKESMIDRRLFPRIFALAEQMWSRGPAIPFNDYYEKVQHLKPYFEKLGYQYGPGLTSEVPANYSWD